MFGIGLTELAVLAVVAIFVFGPENLPEFAKQAGRIVRQAKRFADGARDQLRDELGPEYADLELRDLDPRVFVRKQIDAALADADLADSDKDAPKKPAPRPTLPAGERPPYDSDAT
jgi:sec-independent protein translocase protein TatB